MTYYNEHDLKAAAWLEMLSISGEIATGDVDPRDIQKVRADDLKDYDRCHFFAGIGGWDYALRLAGWPATRPVWTASLPCQPFSAAGKKRGTEDERHLWPVFRDLVEQCRPAILFGEQVASKPGRAWLASVQIDLEALGYSTAAADLCAAGVGAPHIRQRLYWVAHSSSTGLEVVREQPAREERETVERGGAAGGVGHSEQLDSGRNSGTSAKAEGGAPVRAIGDLTRSSSSLGADESGGVVESKGIGWKGPADRPSNGSCEGHGGIGRAGGPGNWDDIVYLPCADGKARPIKPGIEPLVDGLPGRVGLLRGYGNAIVPQVAAVFIRSVMEAVK